MAARELYDELSDLVADYTANTLTVEAQGEVTEEGSFKQPIYIADNYASEYIPTLANAAKRFYVTWKINRLNASDIGTFMDFYFDTAKARGKSRTFYWQAYDGHTYTVRFDMDWSRTGDSPNRWGMPNIRMYIRGRKAA